MHSLSMPSPSTSNTILERIEEIAPLIRELAPQAERECRLAEPVAEALRDRGFFRLFRPESRGEGLDLDPVTGFQVIEELSCIDSAAGWNVAIANAIEPLGAWCSDEVTDEVFGAPDAILAGSWSPPRKAVPCTGGYHLSGRTPFASNCHSATWFTSLAHVHENGEPRLGETGAPITYLTFLPESDVEIIDNWDTLGMRGTGSHDIQVDGAFIPENRLVPLQPLETFPPAYDRPFSRLASWPGVAAQVPPAFGIARQAIEGFLELAGAKTPNFTSEVLRTRPVVQVQVARAQGRLDAARAFFYSVFEEMWERAVTGKNLEMADRARIQLACTHGVEAAAEAVDLVHSLAGTSGIRNDQPFQRHFRDIHVITQHAFVSASRFQAVGQVLLGVDPDWPFFQLWTRRDGNGELTHERDPFEPFEGNRRDRTWPMAGLWILRPPRGRRGDRLRAVLHECGHVLG